MRPLILIALIVFARAAICAVDLSDLGIANGGTALQYEEYGINLAKKDNYEAARRYYAAAIRLEPDRWTAYYNRAMTYVAQKNWAAALQDLNATVHYKPAFFRASITRAAVNKRLGNYHDSLRDLDLIVNLSARVGNFDEHALVLNNRAWMRAVCPDASIRNGQLAVADAKTACQLSKWKISGYIDTLAAAYAEAGDFDSAIRYQEQAISRKKEESEEESKYMASHHFKKDKVEKISPEIAKDSAKMEADYAHRLQLYNAHRPYRPSGDW